MMERPILFSGPMVRAILEGRKTMTRRVVKRAFDGCTWAGDVHPARIDGWVAWWPGNTDPDFTIKAYEHGFPCPYGQPGDKLWVRETWGITGKPCPYSDMQYGIQYRADDQILYPDYPIEDHFKVMDWSEMGWKPSIHMPRWASRITLEITGVRVERLQEITEEDAKAEGVESISINDVPRQAAWSNRQDFAQLWDSINAKRGYGWSVNPWVWVIEFKGEEST